MEPIISVIVPIYNVEKYLHKCIESILNQTLSNIEVILVNDGSTDKCLEIINSYSKKDERIKVINKANGGQSSARNMGLDIARGKYIGFVDSDDWLHYDMYENLYEAIEKSNADICVCGREAYSEEGKIGYQNKLDDELIDLDKYDIKDYVTNKLFYKHTVVVWNKIYKKDIINKNNIRFEDVSYVGSEDALFNYQYLMHTKKIKAIDKIGYSQLSREGSTATSYKKGYIVRTSNLIECMDDYSNKINSKEIGNDIIPSILLFYNQWCLSQIKIHSDESNILRNIQDELIQGMDSKVFRIYIKKIITDKCMINNMKSMGFKLKGILLIKLYMTLCYFKKYKIASKLIASI